MLIKIKQDNMKPLKQMQVDPLTGMPVTTPGPEQGMNSRSSQLYAGANPGYAQGSMDTAMKSNPLIANVASQGLTLNQGLMKIGDKSRARKAAKAEAKRQAELQALSDKIGDNPTYSASGDVKSSYDPNKKAEYTRQRLIHEDENPKLTEDDKYDISRKIQQPEFNQKFIEPDIGDPSGRTEYSLNTQFQKAATEKLKEKHEAAMTKLGRTKSWVDPNYRIKDKTYYNYKSPTRGMSDELEEWEMD